MDEQATAQATTARIRETRFRTRRWGGYDDREVDNFLDELIARLDRGESAGQGSGPSFHQRTAAARLPESRCRRVA
jgi:DivIVA domain-containing protein